jgi:hypothetical protein
MPAKRERRAAYSLSRRGFRKLIQDTRASSPSQPPTSWRDRAETGWFRLVLALRQRSIWWTFLGTSLWIVGTGWLVDRSPGRVLAYQACAMLPALFTLVLRYIERRLFDDR